MDVKEISGRLMAIYNTLDSVFVIGVENQAKIVGAANAIRSTIADLQNEAKKEAEKAPAKTPEGGKAKNGHNN